MTGFSKLTNPRAAGLGKVTRRLRRGILMPIVGVASLGGVLVPLTASASPPASLAFISPGPPCQPACHNPFPYCDEEFLPIRGWIFYCSTNGENIAPIV